MTLALKRIKVYVKLIAILTVLAIVLLIVLENQDNKATIWFFKPYGQVNVVWLMLVTAVASIAGWWVVMKIFGTLRELRRLREAQRNQDAVNQQQRLAQELAEREKRIDEKLRRSITED